MGDWVVFGHNVFFYLTIVGAGLLKIALSPWGGYFKSAVSFAVAVFMGAVFTGSVIEYLAITSESYKFAAAAVVTLTGESIARYVLQIVSDPAKLTEWIKIWRGNAK